MSPIGKEVHLHNIPFRVVGLLPRKGVSIIGTDQDDIVLVPWTTLNDLRGKSAAAASKASSDTPQPTNAVTVDSFYVKAKSAEEVAPAMKQIAEVLRTRHHLPAGRDEDDFQIRDMNELIKRMTARP